MLGYSSRGILVQMLFCVNAFPWHFLAKQCLPAFKVQQDLDFQLECLLVFPEWHGTTALGCFPAWPCGWRWLCSQKGGKLFFFGVLCAKGAAHGKGETPSFLWLALCSHLLIPFRWACVSGPRFRGLYTYVLLSLSCVAEDGWYFSKIQKFCLFAKPDYENANMLQCYEWQTFLNNKRN